MGEVTGSAPTGRPLVSVVAPVFNPGDALRLALENITSLTYANLEVIVVDDASTVPCDAWGRLDLARTGLTRDVNWIRLTTNGGPAHARNVGLAAATGAYVWFVDWDDEWDPQLLDRLVNEAESTQADIAMCAGRWQIGGERGPATDGLKTRMVMDRDAAFVELLNGGIRGYLWTKIFRREILGTAPFAPHGYIEDLFVVAEVVSRSNAVASIPDSLYWHIVREGSLSNSKDPQLHHLEEASAYIRGLATGFTHLPQLERGLAHYELEFNHIARAATAIRLCEPPRAREVLRDVRRQIRVRDIRRVARAYPGTAARAATIKVTGPYFPEVRAFARAAARRIRRAGAAIARSHPRPSQQGVPA